MSVVERLYRYIENSSLGNQESSCYREMAVVEKLYKYIENGSLGN